MEDRDEHDDQKITSSEENANEVVDDDNKTNDKDKKFLLKNHLKNVSSAVSAMKVGLLVQM